MRIIDTRDALTVERIFTFHWNVSMSYCVLWTYNAVNYVWRKTEAEIKQEYIVWSYVLEIRNYFLIAHWNWGLLIIWHKYQSAKQSLDQTHRSHSVKHSAVTRSNTAQSLDQTQRCSQSIKHCAVTQSNTALSLNQTLRCHSIKHCTENTK